MCIRDSQAKATADYSAASGVNSVSYANPTGSGAGKTAFFTAGQDFAGSDSAVSATQTGSTAFSWVYVPYVAGAISVAYRLDALAGSTLNLSIPTAAGIFAGTIKNWNDPAIVADMAANAVWANSTKKSGFKGASAL